MIGRPKVRMSAATRKQAQYDRLMRMGIDPEEVRVPGDGPTPARVMLIGMRPGREEPLADPPRPFIGMAGKELDRYLRHAGLTRDEVYVTNLVKTWAIGDREPEEWEVVRDSDDLRQEFEGVKPEVIVPLGAVATRRLLAEWATMEVVSGIPHRNGSSATIFPIYHPAAGLHNPEMQPHIVDGFGRLGAYLGGTLSAPKDERPNPIYTEAFEGDTWWHHHSTVAIDTEGSRKDPICLQFSRWAGEGRLIRAEDQRLLSDFHRSVTFAGDEATYLLHNSLHDLEVLDRLGIELPEGRYIDTMILAYLLCLEPQGLKALAYRHAGRLRKDYDEVVGPASRQKAYEYIQMLREYDWGEAEPYVETKIEKGQVVSKVHRPHSLNRRLDRIVSDFDKDRNGVDIRSRWNKMVSDNPGLVVRVDDLIGPMPSATLRDVDPETARDYACADSDDTIRIYPRLMSRIYEMGLQDVCRLDHDIIPCVNRMQRIGMPVVRGWFEQLALRMSREMEAIQVNIQKATNGWWINPDAPSQCADYLFLSPTGPKLPWTKWTKSGERPKCDDKVLEGLIAQAGGPEKAHPVLRMITDYRERSKIKSSFCLAILYLIEEDDRLRTNLRITRVSSGRLSSSSDIGSARKLNLLAIPVRTALGLEVRRGFVAPEGRVLSSRDLDQIEMREMAHQSQDPEMLKIFREGRVDIHTRTAGMMYGKKDDDVKKIERYAAKRIGFGIITGITEVGLKDQMDLAGADGWTENRCAEAIREYLVVYSGVRSYMEACRAEARRHGYVRDRWGRIRYLPGIHSPIAKVRAEAERQSHSFKISASAQGTIKRAMKMWWDDVWHPVRNLQGGYIEPLLQIHDSKLREVDECWAKEEDSMLEAIMEKADPRMTVPIKSKGKWGPDWADLD